MPLLNCELFDDEDISICRSIGPYGGWYSLDVVVGVVSGALSVSVLEWQTLQVTIYESVVSAARKHYWTDPQDRYYPLTYHSLCLSPSVSVCLSVCLCVTGACVRAWGRSCIAVFSGIVEFSCSSQWRNKYFSVFIKPKSGIHSVQCDRLAVFFSGAVEMIIGKDGSLVLP